MRNFDYFNIFGKRVTIHFLVFVSWRSLVLKPRFFEQKFVYRVSEQILSPQMKFGATQTIKGPKPRVIPFLERHSPYWPGRWKGSRSIISEKDVTSSRGALELSYDPSLPLESIDLSRSRSLAAEKRTYISREEGPLAPALATHRKQFRSWISRVISSERASLSFLLICRVCSVHVKCTSRAAHNVTFSLNIGGRGDRLREPAPVAGTRNLSHNMKGKPVRQMKKI